MQSVEVMLLKSVNDEYVLFLLFGVFFTWISETNDYVSLPHTYEFEMIKKHYIVVGLISYLGLAT